MEDNRLLLDTISTVAATIDPLMRANQMEAIKVVTEKLLDLIEEIE